MRIFTAFLFALGSVSVGITNLGVGTAKGALSKFAADFSSSDPVFSSTANLQGSNIAPAIAIDFSLLVIWSIILERPAISPAIWLVILDIALRAPEAKPPNVPSVAPSPPNALLTILDKPLTMLLMLSDIPPTNPLIIPDRPFFTVSKKPKIPVPSSIFIIELPALLRRSNAPSNAPDIIPISSLKREQLVSRSPNCAFKPASVSASSNVCGKSSI